MKLLLLMVIGYLIGSIPFALVIGKVFYKTDVREHGSHNLGGSNTGRVLGKKAGLSVMTTDLLKVTFVVFLAVQWGGGEVAAVCGALAAAFGHCFPIFARFRGGKAVATMYGFLFGLFTCLGYNILIFLLPIVVFLTILYVTKIVSLSSIGSAIAATVYAALSTGSVPVTAGLVVFTLLIVVRHRANIERVVQHRENKITWM
jgi:glycerol-3-phosphate acyltransferase PlsY